MFSELSAKGRSRAARFRRRGIAMTLSLSLHLAVITAVVVVPLVEAESELPAMKVIQVSVVGVPPAPVYHGGGRGRSGKSSTALIKFNQKIVQNARPISTRFIAPSVVKPMDELIKEVGEYDPDALQNDPDDSRNGPGGSEGPDDGILTPEGPAEGPAMRISSVRIPRLIRKVIPEYPEVARLSRVREMLVVEARTDIYGRVREVRIVRGHPLLNDAVITAVRQWIYEPYLVNGVPRPVIFTVTVHFKLENL